MDNKEIGIFISTLRKSKKMTQNNLAEKLGVTNKAISKWETGEGYPEITIIPKLAEELGISIDELLSANLNESPETYIESMMPLQKRYEELIRYMNMNSIVLAFNLIGLGAFVYFHTWSWNLSLVGFFVMFGFSVSSIFLLVSSYSSFTKIRLTNPSGIEKNECMGKRIRKMYLIRLTSIIFFIAATLPFVPSVWSKPYASHLTYIIWLFVTIPAATAIVIILFRNTPEPSM